MATKKYAGFKYFNSACAEAKENYEKEGINFQPDIQLDKDLYYVISVPT